MARRAKELTARQVVTLKAGVHGDGNGLFLNVKASGARSWQVLYQLPGAGQPRRRIGLGAVDKPYSLAEAREQAREIQKKAKLGIDVLAERETPEEAAKVDVVTFRQCAEAFIDSRRVIWKNSKHADQWPATLSAYVYPRLGDMPVQDITTFDVYAVLEPIWLTKPTTAGRVRNRIEAAIDWAIATDHRTGDNPARWAGKLKTLLPPLAKAVEAVHREKGTDGHLREMSWRDMPAFMSLLARREGTPARALEFTILTAARTEQARAAMWNEIDFDELLWVIPGARMKMGKEHKVPLVGQMLNILYTQKEYSEYVGSPYVFPGDKPHCPMHSNSMYALLTSYMGFSEITVHGFRSTFAEWQAHNMRGYDAAREMALAHSLGRVERAYQRDKLLDQRRELAEAWARYIYAHESDVVVPMRAARG